MNMLDMVQIGELFNGCLDFRPVINRKVDIILTDQSGEVITDFTIGAFDLEMMGVSEFLKKVNDDLESVDYQLIDGDLIEVDYGEGQNRINQEFINAMR